MLRLLRSMFGRTPRSSWLLLAGYLVLVFTLSAGHLVRRGDQPAAAPDRPRLRPARALDYLRTRRLAAPGHRVAGPRSGCCSTRRAAAPRRLRPGGAVLVSHRQHPGAAAPLWDRYRWASWLYASSAVAYLALYVAYGLNFSPTEAGNQRLAPDRLEPGRGRAAARASSVGRSSWQPLDVGSFADPPSSCSSSRGCSSARGLLAHRTRTVSRRAWSLVAFPLLINVVLLGVGPRQHRRPRHRPEYRYQTETAALFCSGARTGVPAAPRGLVRNDLRPRSLSPMRPARAPPGRRRRRRGAPWSRPCGTSTSGRRATRRGLLRQRPRARPPGDAASGPARRRQRAADDALGLPIPGEHLQPRLRNLRLDIRYPGAAIDRLYLFDDGGELRPVTVPNTRELLPRAGAATRCLEDATSRLPLNGPSSAAAGGCAWGTRATMTPP